MYGDSSRNGKFHALTVKVLRRLFPGSDSLSKSPDDWSNGRPASLKALQGSES